MALHYTYLSCELSWIKKKYCFHLTHARILKTKRHRTYVGQCFRLLFNKESHYRQLVCKCRFTIICKLVQWGGRAQLGLLGTAATNRPIVPAPGDYDDEEIGGMIGRGNRSTGRKPAPVPLCPPQTPHAARTRTRAAAVGSQRLTAWAPARPRIICNSKLPVSAPINRGVRHGRPLLATSKYTVHLNWIIYTRKVVEITGIHI
jgi:hypothetical protein